MVSGLCDPSELTDRLFSDQWKYVLLVSKPFIDHTEFPVEARSLHWITDPEALIICYLNHGIL